MTLIQKLSMGGGLLLCGLGLPIPSFAVGSCNNTNLVGTYNASLTSAAFANVVSHREQYATSATSGTGTGTGTGTTTGTGTGTGTTAPVRQQERRTTTGTGTGTSSSSVATGLVGNASSINGNVPALGRFYFDGNGNILGCR